MKKYIPLFLFAVVIMGVFIIDISMPMEEFSETENRVLAKYSPPTVETIKNGDFMSGYDSYVSDQFMFRSQWISLKSIGETLLLKTENNDIVYGENGYMFDREEIEHDENSRLQKNLDFIDEFAKAHPNSNISFSLVPSSIWIYRDKLPIGLESEISNQTEIINKSYSYLSENSNVFTMDLGPVLQKEKDNYIYYRTDHHWTTLGAYKAYENFADAKNHTAVDLESISSHEVEDFYGTYYNKAKKISAKPDVVTYYDIPFVSVEIDGEEKGGMYDLEQFSKGDKYAGILYGNNGITVIESETKNEKSILVVKDSYAASMVPFLLNDYQYVYMIDLRYYKDTPELLEKVNFDDIYIIYYLPNFSTDGNVINLLN